MDRQPPDAETVPFTIRANAERWPDGQPGRAVELMAAPGGKVSNDPLVCVAIDGPDGVSFAWFHVRDIHAGMIDDPEFSLSVDAMVSRYRPRRLADGRVRYLFPETNEWRSGHRYEGPTGS